MKSTIIFLSVMLCACATFSQEKQNLVNQQSPPVVFQKTLEGNISPDFYKNKILVLDFWATWCAPCIATFPHFNELSKKYSGKDVVFATITDEPLTILEKYFKRSKKELDAIKLSDTVHKTGKSFNVITIPYCVVIDKNNMVKWTGESFNLTAAVLDKIIANQPDVTQPVKGTATLEAQPQAKQKPIEQRAVFSFSVALSDTSQKSHSGLGARTSREGNYLDLSITCQSLSDCMERLTGFSRVARMKTNDTLKMKQLIDLDFKAGKDTALFVSYKNEILPNAARNNAIITLIGNALKFNTRLIKQVQKHYELVIIDSAKLHTFRSMQDRHSSFSDDYLPKFEIVGYNLKDITTNLESSMKTIITTHIADKDPYDLSLEIGNIATVNKTLAFHGLKLKEVKDEVELLNLNFY